MAKIKKRDIYPQDLTLSGRDYVIGTDHITGKTKTYELYDIAQYIASIGDGTEGGSHSKVLSGSITWIGGLNYYATEIVYVINGDMYVSPPKFLTVEPSNLLDRIDVFAVTTSQDTVVIQGDPSENPLEATVNFETQLRVSSVYVKSGSTTPEGVYEDIIYNENIGLPTEWNNVSTTYPTVDFQDAYNPKIGKVAIRYNEALNTQSSLSFSKEALIENDGLVALTFWIKAKAGSIDRIAIKIANGNSSASGYVFGSGKHGFNEVVTDEYQLVSVPFNLINPSNNNFTSLSISFKNGPSGKISAFVDNIRLVYDKPNYQITGHYLKRPSEIYANFNFDYPLVPFVPTEGETTTIEEILWYLNTRTITIHKTDLAVINVRAKKGGKVIDLKYLFARNDVEGDYGYQTNNSDITKHDLILIGEFPISIPEEPSDKDIVIELGGIDTTNLPYYINNIQEIDWSIEADKSYWFTYKVNNTGEHFTYFYKGPRPVTIGFEETRDYEVTDSDFQLISADGYSEPPTLKIVIEGIEFEYKPSPTNTTGYPMPGDIAINNFNSNNKYEDVLEFKGGDPYVFSSWINPNSLEENIASLPIFKSMDEALMHLGEGKMFRYDTNNYDGVPSPKNSSITITKY